MSGILIFAFLVNCSQSLLICETIDTREFAFSDMAACRGELSDLVADHQRQLGDTRVAMGQCRYQLVEHPNDRETFTLPKGRRIRAAAIEQGPNDQSRFSK